MGIILDLILILIIIVNIYLCYKKGLVKLAVGLIAVFASIILAVILYKPVSSLVINNTQIDENIENAIVENFTKEYSDSSNKEDDGFMKYIEQYVDDAVNKTRNQVVIEASKIIAIKVINIGVLLGLFIILRLVFLLLNLIADMITELPILKQFNEVGGILYGLIKSLLIIYVILAILFFIIYTTGNNTISVAIANSYITKFFYNYNILLKLLF